MTGSSQQRECQVLMLAPPWGWLDFMTGGSQWVLNCDSWAGTAAADGFRAVLQNLMTSIWPLGHSLPMSALHSLALMQKRGAAKVES